MAPCSAHFSRELHMTKKTFVAPILSEEDSVADATLQMVSRRLQQISYN